MKLNRRDFLAGIGGVVGLGEVSTLGSRAVALAQTVGGRGRGSSVVSEPDYAALLGQHDIVYLTPVEEGPEGLPIGNGDLVGMVWMPPRGLELVLNKSNLWDDRLDEPPLAENWAWDVKEEEHWTALVSAGRVRIRSALPVLEPIYLDEFQARLDLYRAAVEVESASAIGKVKVRCLIAKEPGVLVVDYDETGREAVKREIELERWGSRRLFHWYSQYDPKATRTGLEGTRAGVDKEYIWIEQQLRKIRFAVAARWMGGGYRTRVESQHRAVLETETSPELKGQLYVAVVTSEEASDPLAAARVKIAKAVESGYDSLLERHRRQWGEFWSKSYVQIPEEYLENLYYFTLYQLAVSSQGSYPPPHCGGFWFWKHDARRWGHYYHWDLQQQYWPVHSSNHPELIEPYLKFRFETLAEAQKQANAVHRREGAFYSDVTDREGRGTVHYHVSNVLSCGPQISADFWRHYLYTQDVEFLRQRAYPLMKACAEFYLNTLVKDESGTFHVPQATAYENYILQKDTITDLASIRQLFPACIQASITLGVDHPLRERWKVVLDRLAEFITLEDAHDEDGRKLPRVFASGLPLHDSYAGPDSNWHWARRRVVQKGKPEFNISFLCELASIFPSGVIGLNQERTQLFEVARNTVRSLGSGPSYASVPLIAAVRLGMNEEALKQLIQLPRLWQLSFQGFFANVEQTHRHDYSSDRWAMETPRKILAGGRTDERAMLPARWFDIPDLEVGGVFMTAINEMLLQSHEGTIRLFPCVSDSWSDIAFKLSAVGGFVITARRQAGKALPFLIASLRGKPCQLKNPWPESRVSIREVSTDRVVQASQTQGDLTFPTEQGEFYRVSPDTENNAQQPLYLELHRGTNRAPKEWHGCQLGMKPHF